MYDLSVTFDTPGWRFQRALYEMKNACVASTDIWVQKAKSIIKLLGEYKRNMEELYDKWPMYYNLIVVHEGNTYGCPRHIIEAALVGGANWEQISRMFGDKAHIYNPAFIALYHHIFFDSPAPDPVTERISPEWILRHILPAACRHNSKKLGTEWLWKLVAAKQGFNRFYETCVLMGAQTGDDKQYLMDVGNLRNDTLVLNYTADGFLYLEEKDIVLPIALKTMERIGSTSSTHGPDGMAKIDFKENPIDNFEEIGLGDLMVSKFLNPVMLSEAKANKAGQFVPDMPEAVEKLHVYNYIHSQTGEVQE